MVVHLLLQHCLVGSLSFSLRGHSFQTRPAITQSSFLGTQGHGQGRPGPTGKDPKFYPNYSCRDHLRQIIFPPWPLAASWILCSLTSFHSPCHLLACFPSPIILITSTILPTPPHLQNLPSMHFLYFIKYCWGKEHFFRGTQEPPLRAPSSFHNQKSLPGDEQAEEKTAMR